MQAQVDSPKYISSHLGLERRLQMWGGGQQGAERINALHTALQAPYVFIHLSNKKNQYVVVIVGIVWGAAQLN